MNKTQQIIMRGFLVATIAIACAIFTSGCASTPEPIKTTLDLTTSDTGLPQLNYSSEKDVLYSRTTTDSETGITEQVDFKALASAAGLAQAEREAIDAETRKAQAESLNAALQVISANAASVLGGQPTLQAQPAVSSTTDLERARVGQPLLRAVSD